MNSSYISCTQNIGAYFIGNFFPTPSEPELNLPLTYTFTSSDPNLQASDLEAIVTTSGEGEKQYTISQITKSGSTFSFTFTPKSSFSTYNITIRNKTVTQLTSPTMTVQIGLM